MGKSFDSASDFVANGQVGDWWEHAGRDGRSIDRSYIRERVSDTEVRVDRVTTIYHGRAEYYGRPEYVFHSKMWSNDTMKDEGGYVVTKMIISLARGEVPELLAQLDAKRFSAKKLNEVHAQGIEAYEASR